jgi:hypothetical protein
MAFTGLSVATILVNDIPTDIVPNSFEYEPGFGEITVRSTSFGGGASGTVHTEDAEGKVGMVKFQLYVTDLSRANVRLWKSGVGVNRISAIQVGAAPIVLNGASMTNNPSFAATADGTVEVEFKGDPMPTP